MEFTWSNYYNNQCMSETLEFEDNGTELLCSVSNLADVENVSKLPSIGSNRKKPAMLSSTQLPIDLIPLDAFQLEPCELSPTSSFSNWTYENFGSDYSLQQPVTKIDENPKFQPLDALNYLSSDAGIGKDNFHLSSFLDSCVSYHNSLLQTSNPNSPTEKDLSLSEESYWPEKELRENEALGINFGDSIEKKINVGTDFSSSSSAYGSMSENEFQTNESDYTFDIWKPNSFSDDIWKPTLKFSESLCSNKSNSFNSSGSFQDSGFSTINRSKFNSTPKSLEVDSVVIPDSTMNHWYRNIAFTLSMVDSDDKRLQREETLKNRVNVDKKIPKAATLRTRRRQKRNKKIREVEKLFMK